MEHKLPALAVCHGRAGAAHFQGDARVPLRQASPDLRHQPEQPDQGHRVREHGARGHHQEVLRRRVQQRRAGLEPHLLLELHGARRPAASPSGPLADAINKKLGSFAAFKEAFNKSAAGNFGSGWTWLVKKADGTLDIVNTSNAGTPLTTTDKPLLTCDVWEHAYYIDYRNKRPDYLSGGGRWSTGTSPPRTWLDTGGAARNSGRRSCRHSKAGRRVQQACRRFTLIARIR